ncbi:hypothetical protein LPJ64_001053 [Coemansia asiatica]|uniref:Serine carboxypeptidase n=1 Tax=Coemansia asiatica TaxID=1052880 RepID=A0A9W7XPR9_9FUNG|nr:hypothetical protein LPJ64_001053 [Coemansia asiatica]
MRRIISLAFFALVSSCQSSSSSDNQAAAAVSIPSSSVVYQFSQPIDHFGLNNNLWEQCYQLNATFYKPGGPIILVTPGETSISTYYTDGSYFTNLAQQTNGLVVAVEHRFYGGSNPMPDLSGSSLKFHTIDNVLEDFASFARAAKSDPASVFPVDVSDNSKIIFGGGSYAGAIAAWMRAKYPEIIDGAWASSAVVQYRLENYQLDQSWGKHLAALGCAVEMSQAVKDLDDILLSGNQTAVSNVQARFASPELTPQDFAGLVTSLISIDATSTITKDVDYTGQSVCAYFDGKRSNLDSYAWAIRDTISYLKLDQSSITQMADTTLNWDKYALGQSGRVWYYQECAWYGNWQVAPPQGSGYSPYRSRLVDLIYFEPNCKNKFGQEMPDHADADGFHQKWFNMLGNVSNIYYTVGSLDLWRGSTVVPWEGSGLPNTTDSPIYLINGADHSQDVGRVRANDLDSVKEARAIGSALVQKWIS